MSNAMDQRDPAELLVRAQSALWGSALGQAGLVEGASRRDASPLAVPLELRETDDAYLVLVEIPGISRGRLRVTCDDRTVVITGERKEGGAGAVRYSERSYGAFSRSVTLPAPIDADAARACYVDGVLEILLPKALRSPRAFYVVVREALEIPL